ncbi:MAG: cyclodeaminase/cyclohydrolase family protein, partial [Oscillospiraceae bacterium]|nr:cyclodeaminase/cyclohydrolase family protein [Oscillospiraceae bacterium]
MNEEQFIQLSCADFSARLSSAAPVPGGGGASALVAALGAA